MSTRTFAKRLAALEALEARRNTRRRRRYHVVGRSGRGGWARRLHDQASAVLIALRHARWDAQRQAKEADPHYRYGVFGPRPGVYWYGVGGDICEHTSTPAACSHRTCFACCGRRAAPAVLYAPALAYRDYKGTR